MATYRVVPSVEADIELLKGRLRAADVLEISAMFEGTADEALAVSYKNSTLCWTVFVDGNPEFVFGVVPGKPGTGIPWLLGTDAVSKASLRIVRHSKEYVGKMLEKYPHLENFVDVKNELSKAWLKWCGFTIEEPVAYGLKGELFHRFHMGGAFDLEQVFPKGLDKATVREKILALEKSLGSQPGAEFGDMFPLEHFFADGMCVRQIVLPKGSLVVGKIHKHSHPNFILSGDVTVVTEEGCQRIKGPCGMISAAGTKRVVYAHEDTTWAVVHATHETDIAKIEDEVIAKSYEEYDQFAIGRKLWSGSQSELQQLAR